MLRCGESGRSFIGEFAIWIAPGQIVWVTFLLSYYVQCSIRNAPFGVISDTAIAFHYALTGISTQESISRMTPSSPASGNAPHGTSLVAMVRSRKTPLISIDQGRIDK